MNASEHEAPIPHFTISLEGELSGADSEESRDLARRIHACVNACDGIPTDELENGIVEDMRRVIAQVVPVLRDRKQTLEGELRQRSA